MVRCSTRARWRRWRRTSSSPSRWWSKSTARRCRSPSRFCAPSPAWPPRHSEPVSESRDLLFLSQSDVVRLLDLDKLFDALANAFVELSAGRASVPPRIAARTASGGLLGAMPGFVSGVLEAKLVSVFPQNHVRGIPSHQGLIVLFDDSTGTPIAVMDGIAITAIRTGASAAVAARWLARHDSATLAILGAGVQGRSHLEAFTRARPFQEIRIASRNTENAKTLAAGNPLAAAAGSFEEAVRGADVVCCCTDAREPI